MALSDQIEPEAWWEPRFERQRLFGHRCRECGHELDPFDVLYLAGPWEPATAGAALEGRLNPVTCGVCKISYSFEVPLLICAPDLNRHIIVIDVGFIIPHQI